MDGVRSRAGEEKQGVIIQNRMFIHRGNTKTNMCAHRGNILIREPERGWFTEWKIWGLLGEWDQVLKENSRDTLEGKKDTSHPGIRKKGREGWPRQTVIRISELRYKGTVDLASSWLSRLQQRFYGGHFPSCAEVAEAVPIPKEEAKRGKPAFISVYCNSPQKPGYVHDSHWIRISLNLSVRERFGKGEGEVY